MELHDLPIPAGILTGATALVGAIIAVFGPAHKANLETIESMRKDQDRADLRRDELEKDLDKAHKRVRELEGTVRIHHDVIRVGHDDLASLLQYRDDLNKARPEFEKILDKLDTRIR